MPTTAEAGLSGFEVDYWYAVLGPAGMPAPLVAIIRAEIAAIVSAPEMKQSLLAQGTVAVGSTPEEAAARIRSDYGLWRNVVKAGKVSME